MEATWILVADAARARVFRVERPRGPLIEVSDFVHPEDRLHESALGSDDPGRIRGSGGTQHAFGPDTGALHDREVERFAGELAEKLGRAGARDRYRRLYIVAPPKFLGALRAALDAATAERVVATLDRDLVRHDPEEIRGHLPYRL